MIRTRVGYAGGTSSNPTYRRIGDHSETIQIDYDPNIITYEELLDIFWNAHYPSYKPHSRQYASILFYHDEEQKKLAEETKARTAASLGTTVFTEIVPFDSFTLAENYHQKYYLQQKPELMRELTAMYPTMDGIINSTAAARLNGYVGYNGTRKKLEEEIDLLGLSPQAHETLFLYVR